MIDQNGIKIHSQIIEGIPCLVIRKEIDQPAPLVFFSHGYESDKRDGIRLGFELAKRGITFVSFDTIWRGDRGTDKLDPDMGEKASGIYPPETGLDETLAFFQMIRQTGKDVKTLMDHFREDQRIDPDRIGLSGYSMGGMVAFYCAGFFPELSAVAAIAGIAGIESFWHEILLQTRLDPGMPADLKPLETML
jgi:dienelactone hydrolase